MNLAAAAPIQTDLTRRLRAIPAPRPMLDRDREHRLTTRQREILDQLGSLFSGGFSHLTMADIASQLNCSLRTLYGLASSRDELVLTVIDRNLWEIGRNAMGAIEPDMAPLDALRAYLAAATVAVSGTTEELARDLAAMPSAERRNGAHSQYLVAVSRGMLDIAVERGDIPDIDTAAVARVVAGLGHDFARPDAIAELRDTPKLSADMIMDIILRGLRSLSEQDPRTDPTSLTK